MLSAASSSLFESPIRRDNAIISQCGSEKSSSNQKSKLTTINPFDFKSKDYFISRYSFVDKFIQSIHNERIWKVIRLNEAMFNLSMAKESHPECFHPMISLIEIEVDLILFIISGSKTQLENAKDKCIENLRSIQKILKDIEVIEESLITDHSTENAFNVFDCDEFHVFNIECHFIEAEIQLITSALDIYQKSYLSGGQQIMKSINNFFKILTLIEDLKKSLLKKKVIEIISMESSKESSCRMSKDDDVILELENLIDLKTKEIRSKNIDRRGIISEEVIEATRDLLQYKELYRELKGAWKSSDGHADMIVDESLYNSNKLIQDMNTLSINDDNNNEEITNEKDIKINLFNTNSEISNNNDDDKENVKVHFNTIDKSRNNKNTKKNVKRTASLKSKHIYHSPVRKNLKKNISNSFKVPIVHVMIPGLPTLYNFFLNNSNSQKIESPKKRTTSLYKHDISPIKAKNTPTKSNDKMKSINKTNIFNTIEDFSKYNRNTIVSNNIEKYIINLESRLSFAFGVFNLLGCFVPGELAWVLKIINLSPNIGVGFGKLFQVHIYKDCIWANLSSIILLNIPSRVITKGFHDTKFVNSLGPTISVSANTFTSLIEAQLLIRMPKNYLFLFSVANYKYNNSYGLTTKLSISQRINYLTRAITDINNDNINDKTIVPFFALVNLIKYYFYATDWNNSLESCIRLETFCLNRSLYKPTHIPRLYKISNLLILKSFNKSSSYIYNNQSLKYEKVNENLKNKDSVKIHYSNNNLIQYNKTTINDLLTELITEFEEDSSNQYISLLNKLRTYQLWGSIYLKSEKNPKNVDEILWLLPIELIYMIDNENKNIVSSEANHSNLLMQLDKGALFFADTIIQLRTDNNDSYRLLADLIKAIILDNLSNRDKSVLRDAVNPSNEIEIYYEKMLFGTPTIRLRTKAIPHENNSLFSDLKDRVASMDANLSDIVSLVATRCNSIKNGKLFSSISKVQIVGDIVLRWLNLRGLVLTNMGKVYDACIMYKLMESLQSFAIIDKISSISANYHLAELVLDYTIINEPVKIASIYLDKSSRLLQTKNAKKSAYFDDYYIRIKDLIRRL